MGSETWSKLGPEFKEEFGRESCPVMAGNLARELGATRPEIATRVPPPRQLLTRSRATFSPRAWPYPFSMGGLGGSARHAQTQSANRGCRRQEDEGDRGGRSGIFRFWAAKLCPEPNIYHATSVEKRTERGLRTCICYLWTTALATAYTDNVKRPTSFRGPWSRLIASSMLGALAVMPWCRVPWENHLVTGHQQPSKPKTYGPLSYTDPKSGSSIIGGCVPVDR